MKVNRISDDAQPFAAVTLTRTEAKALLYVLGNSSPHQWREWMAQGVSGRSFVADGPKVNEGATALHDLFDALKTLVME